MDLCCDYHMVTDVTEWLLFFVRSVPNRLFRLSEREFFYRPGRPRTRRTDPERVRTKDNWHALCRGIWRPTNYARAAQAAPIYKETDTKKKKTHAQHAIARARLYGASLEEIARKTGISKRTLIRWDAGGRGNPVLVARLKRVVRQWPVYLEEFTLIQGNHHPWNVLGEIARLGDGPRDEQKVYDILRVIGLPRLRAVAEILEVKAMSCVSCGAELVIEHENGFSCHYCGEEWPKGEKNA